MERPKISEVFTPRSAKVNEDMYIDRPDLQIELKRAVEGTLHGVLCGESGSGKSWLYRHVAEREGWNVVYANAGNVARSKSLTNTIADAIFEDGEREWVEYNQTIGGEVGAFGFGGSTDAERKYTVRKKEVLLKAFQAARKKHGKRIVVLVIDNLEAVFNKPELMEELGNIILLLDDPDYAEHAIKILIVGVPAELIEYFQKTPNLETVSNRMRELPSVNALSTEQIDEFVKRGFKEILHIQLTQSDLSIISKHLGWVTLGIAQRVHEYCEILAHLIEEGAWQFKSEQLLQANGKFLTMCLKRAYAVIDGCMNERRTKAGRRNQVLYSLGKVVTTEFDASTIERHLRKEFPESTKNTALAVGQMLSDLTNGTSPLLRRVSKGASFRFADSRYLMCIRAALEKTFDEGRVFKKTFKR